ncbi:MAG: M48 family metalloprotease, partial [Acidobacteriota bacterium]
FVTRGMLDLGLDDDMLAGLLGHEIAHVTEQHGVRMQKRAQLLNILSQALLVGVLVGVDSEPARTTYDAGENRKGSLVQGAIAGSIVLSELLLRDYSREFETEADEGGQRLAAAAGYDPNGAAKLWALMLSRLPQTKEYGYWRTHPFSDERKRAATARALDLAILKPKPVETYRKATQALLLEHLAELPDPEPIVEPRRPQWPDDDSAEDQERRRELATRIFLENAALASWPRGDDADQLRQNQLHRQRDVMLRKSALQRDYGAVLASYDEQLEIVASLDADSDFLDTLQTERRDLREKADELFPTARKVWEGGVYETPFLHVFLSNYPDAEERAAVALALGNGYARLGRQADAVSQYLHVIEIEPESKQAEVALRGLRNLAPALDDMTALAELGDTTGDAEIRQLAKTRLDKLADSYELISDGAAYLDRFPNGAHAEVIRDRLDTLAQNLYGEVVLYQAIGDSVKAVERINLILLHAPLSPAARTLRDKAVLDT